MSMRGIRRPTPIAGQVLLDQLDRQAHAVSMAVEAAHDLVLVQCLQARKQVVGVHHAHTLGVSPCRRLHHSPYFRSCCARTHACRPVRRAEFAWQTW